MINGRKTYFPMFIDISEKKIVVAGGGRIAQRRVETLLKFADDITVIAPEVTDKIRKRVDEGKVRWIKKAFCRDTEESRPDERKDLPDVKKSTADINRLLEEADMVLAATNDTVCNERIVRMCRRRGIPVNASHKKELCDFYFPAVVVKDHVTVGITSGGLSHAQARKVREQIETVLGGGMCHAHSSLKNTDDV